MLAKAQFVADIADVQEGLRSVSEHSFSLVRLDVMPAPVTVAVADAIRDWLLERAIIAANDRIDPLWQPSAWKPGSRAREVADAFWFGGFLGTANNGVDISSQRDCYHPVENDEPPACLRCSAPAPQAYQDNYGEWVGVWLDEGTEPAFTCGGCGWTALVGDWVGESSVAIGIPAITFLNWPELDTRFITDARARLGGRTAVVRSHW